MEPVSIYAIPGIKKIDEIIISNAFGIDTDVLFTHTRKREVIEARHFYFWYHVKKFKKVSDKHGFDHATINHAIKNVENLIEIDKEFRDKAELALFELDKLKN
jgi:chromosomal replication initiator protein